MNKENVIKGLETIKHFFGYGLPSTAEMFDSYYGILYDAIVLLKEQDNCENCAIAIEDRQPIVRCKDCKYAHKTYDGDCKYCDMFTDDDGNPIERYRSGDWFCADGERRTDDD